MELDQVGKQGMCTTSSSYHYSSLYKAQCFAQRSFPPSSRSLIELPDTMCSTLLSLSLFLTLYSLPVYWIMWPVCCLYQYHFCQTVPEVAIYSVSLCVPCHWGLARGVSRAIVAYDAQCLEIWANGLCLGEIIKHLVGSNLPTVLIIYPLASALNRFSVHETSLVNLRTRRNYYLSLAENESAFRLHVYLGGCSLKIVHFGCQTFLGDHRFNRS